MADATWSSPRSERTTPIPKKLVLPKTATIINAPITGRDHERILPMTKTPAAHSAIDAHAATSGTALSRESSTCDTFAIITAGSAIVTT